MQLENTGLSLSPRVALRQSQMPCKFPAAPIGTPAAWRNALNQNVFE
jgi:hypothetical protein